MKATVIRDHYVHNRKFPAIYVIQIFTNVFKNPNTRPYPEPV
jgi:hypothetical protein